MGKNAKYPRRTHGVGVKVGFTRVFDVFGASAPRVKYTADDPMFHVAVQAEVIKVIPNYTKKIETCWASRFDEQKVEFDQ